MTWFKVDDSFWSHPKSFTLSHQAVALWVRAGSYCGNHLTDGLVPRHALAILQGIEHEAAELVDAGLWLEHQDGWQFHDWADYQDTKDAVERRREQWRERQNRHRKSDTSLLDEELHSVPFHSPATRDSRVESRRDINGDTPDFTAFWSAYPRKEGKGAARKAYRKALQTVPPETLIEAAERYRDDPNRDAAYTAHASTWLNQERWNDEPLPQRSAATAGERRMANAQRIMAWAASQDTQPAALEAW